MNTKKLADSLQKVLGSAENDDFFDVTSAEENSNEVEEITDDEVNEVMDEESNDDTSDDDISVDTEVEEVDDSGETGDVETEINIDEGEDVEEITDDEVNEVMDEESNDDTSDDDDNDSEIDDSGNSSVVDDEDDNDGDFSDDSSDDEINEDEVVEVNDVQEISKDDYTDGEENIVEVNDIELVNDDGDSLDGINDDDVDEAAEEYDNDDNQYDDADDISEDITDDDVANESEEMEEITDEDLVESGAVEEITDEDIETESSTNNTVIVDEDATASASELLASHGYQFETDACGKLCIQGCDGENCSNVEVVEEFPDDEQISSSDVNLVLHESASDDPFYSVLIKGKPVASIHLKDQGGEDKKDFFVSSDYPKALTEAMVKGGVNKVLDAQNAKRFVASVKASALAEEMKQKAKAEMEEEIKASVVEMKDKFVECVKLAIAGMNKNFFNNKNDFKGAVYNAFANFGASNEVAVKETNKVFASAEPFFNAVVEKAQELMGFDDNSFKTIASAVSDSGIGNVEVETFESKLVKGNNPVIASSFNKSEEVTASSAPAKRLTFKKHIG